ncbi:MAG: hypothetical protein QMB76_06845, partial [Alphaproteobacteria bacterium]
MVQVSQFYRRYVGAASGATLGLFVLLLTQPVMAQSKELSDLAKARDANGNGVIEKSEAGGPIAANF